MSKATRLIFCAGFVLEMLAGCAGQPRAQLPAAGAAAVPPASAPAESAASKDRKFQEVARGYKAIQKEGKTVYCRSEKVVGSTIPTMQCYTEAQLRNAVEAAEATKRRMREGTGG